MQKGRRIRQMETYGGCKIPFKLHKIKRRMDSDLMFTILRESRDELNPFGSFTVSSYHVEA